MALDFPNSPSLNQLFAGPNNVQWQWDGSKWLGTPNTLGPVIVAASPPTFQAGQLWWDSTGGNLYLGYADADTQQWVPVSNITGLANAATTMDVDKALGNVGRNLIHNSMMNVQQRGGGPFTSDLAYTLDRWRIFLTGSTMAVTAITATDVGRGQIGDEDVRFYINANFTGTAGAGDAARINQAIEGVRRLAGKTVIVSFWAIGSTAGIKMGVSLDQIFGTGGSPSTAVTLSGQSVTLTATWARYSTVLTFPSIAGMTLGTAGDDKSQLNFWFTSGATNAARAGNIGVQTGTISLWGVQLEIVQPGQTVPTKLEKRDPVLELQQCQRFFCTGFAMLQTYMGAIGNLTISGMYAVPMRASPILTPSWTNTNVTGPNLGVVNPGNWQAWGTATAIGNTTLNASFTASADL